MTERPVSEVLADLRQIEKHYEGFAKRTASESAALVERLDTDARLAVQRNERAVNVAIKWGYVDGGHHKQWVIAQMVRALLGDSYEEWVDGGWDEGIAP